jgi:hypothetical protein
LVASAVCSPYFHFLGRSFVIALRLVNSLSLLCDLHFGSNNASIRFERVSVEYASVIMTMIYQNSFLLNALLAGNYRILYDLLVLIKYQFI